ncbi:EGFR-like transmembrane domain-containing protein [Aspergillus chevalieri]|uniref:Uncharacterized protein n=1 Tax=Aspergillus chevalieri TaxID=182096 RepID=A0A7R7VUQ7_ASPCH|nr:uncharacterized protein ACHE_61037A [Aspergillus chevalieri]BCR91151.1 hypothetical protein ACHE_61037A [Aspergillus chevalieri]
MELTIPFLQGIRVYTSGPNVATTFNQTFWTTISTTPSPTTTTTVASGTLSGTDGLVNAYGVEIRWQSTDFSNAPATAIATTTGAAAEATHDSSGLSAGASAGIGVGAAVAVIFLVALGFFLLRRRRLPENPPGDGKQGDSYITLPEHPSRMQGEVELPANPSSAAVYQKAELADNPVYEMEGGSKRAELGASSPQ